MVTDATRTDELIPQTVVTHMYCWSTLRPASLGVPGQRDHHRAVRGDVIMVTREEAARGQALGGLTDPADSADGIAAVDELADPLPADAAGDEELAAMDPAELQGYLVQHSGESQRVYALELSRKRGPRKTVLRALGVDPDAGELPEVLPSADALDTAGVKVGESGLEEFGATTGAGGPSAVG